MKKAILAALLAATAAQALATDYYVVVPAPGKAAARLVNIQVALSTASLPLAPVGAAYSYNFAPLLQVTGDSNYTGSGVKWSVSSGSLPPGVTLNPNTGVLSGVPTTAGNYPFTISATYMTKSGPQTYQVSVANITVTLAPASAPQATVGSAYSFDLKPLLTVSGDSSYAGAGVTWSVVSSTLPAGLQLAADGHISGTPTAAGTGTVQVRAAYLNANGEQSYQVVAVDITVALAGAALPTIAAGSAYSYDFKPLLTVTGDPAYDKTTVSWALDAGVLPGGLTLDPSTGILGGTPAPFSDDGAAVTVRATYKTKTARQSYTVYPRDPYYANVVMLAHLDAEPFVNTKTGTTLTEYGGSTGQSTTKKLGDGAAYFNGAGQAVVGPVFHPTGDYTIEGWFYPTSNTTGNNTILDAGGMDQYNWQPQAIYYNWPAAGQINWMASSTNNGTDISNGTKCAMPCNDYISFGTPTLNTWNHFAVVYSTSAGQYMLYLNGVRTATVTTTKKPFQQTTIGTYLGGYPLKTASNLEALFHGYLDDFRLTDGVARYTGATYTVPAFAYPSR